MSEKNSGNNYSGASVGLLRFFFVEVDDSNPYKREILLKEVGKWQEFH